MVEAGRDLQMSSDSTNSRYPRLCPDSSWISPKMETPQHLWATCATVQNPQRKKQPKNQPTKKKKKKNVLHDQIELHVLICSCSLLSYQWALLSRDWRPLLHSLTSDIYTHPGDPPKPSALQTEPPQLSWPHLMWKMPQSLNHLGGSMMNSLQ